MEIVKCFLHYILCGVGLQLPLLIVAIIQDDDAWDMDGHDYPRLYCRRTAAAAGRARAEPGLVSTVPYRRVSQLDRGPYSPRSREGLDGHHLLPSLSRPMPCSSSSDYSISMLAASGT